MAQLLHSTFDSSGINYHVIDKVPEVKKKEYKAYCSSNTCAGVNGGNVRYVRITGVKKSAIFVRTVIAPSSGQL